MTIDSLPADTRLSNADRETGQTHLDTIETEYGVTIILAVAHGSRAWGLHHDGSDYDIKAVYVPESPIQYAQLGSHRETITREFGDYEIEAWDIKKFGELLYKSNDQALDVLRSPIEYRARVDRDDLRAFLEESYNPIQLYHTYRSISKNNYRKYLSHHLTSNRNDTYPIRETTDDGYVVYNTYADSELFVPNRVVDADEEFIELPFDAVDTTDDDERYCPRCDQQPDSLPVRFETTQTRQTVKRNLAVLRASMYARYVKATGERDDAAHELPHVEFPVFLRNQAPTVFETETIELAEELVERKRAGDNTVIGDRIGRDFAHPPEEIPPETHATGNPSQDRINDFIGRVIEMYSVRTADEVSM